ncbi:MAG: hypothetical protein ACTSSK_18360 [Candidatus Heimdallarchaeota archaeon]
MKKSRDLHQSFEKLKTKIAEFENENTIEGMDRLDENTIEGMDRLEIEGVIQQVNRLHDKLEKFRNIVSRDFKY